MSSATDPKAVPTTRPEATPRGAAVISLVDHLLAAGRKYQDLGRAPDALGALHRLRRLRQLPEEANEEIQARLGEIQLKRRKFKQARRHLLAALRHQPGSARYHYLMARACRADERGSLRRAASHYRRSLEADPTSVPCLVEYGLLAIQLGRTDEGLARLRQAVERAPDDPAILAQLVKGLRQAGQADEARRVLRLALFQHPRDRRYRALWQSFQVQMLLQEQELQRLQADPLRDGEGPVLLPFVRPADPGSDRPPVAAISTILRPDSPRSPGHGSTDHRHVQ